jgi:hypothetical protein
LLENWFQTTSDFIQDGATLMQKEEASNESFGKKRRKFRENLTKAVFGVMMHGSSDN